MQRSQFMLAPFPRQFNNELNDYDDDVAADIGPDWQMGFNFPHIKHIMEVYVMRSNPEQSSWRVAGLAMLLVGTALAIMIMVYYCAKRCCSSKKKSESPDEENAEETPSRVNDEHRVNELPSIDDDVKTIVPASFLESPTLNNSQPFQPEPEDLARMQEQMLKQLESTAEEWEIGHGNNDKKPFY